MPYLYGTSSCLGVQFHHITDTIADVTPNANRSNIYRTLKAFNINTVPLEQKEKAKRFKEYEPRFLHIDVTYVPKFDHKGIIFEDRLWGLVNLREGFWERSIIETHRFSVPSFFTHSLALPHPSKNR